MRITRLIGDKFKQTAHHSIGRTSPYLPSFDTNSIERRVRRQLRGNDTGNWRWRCTREPLASVFFVTWRLNAFPDRILSKSKNVQLFKCYRLVCIYVTLLPEITRKSCFDDDALGFYENFSSCRPIFVNLGKCVEREWA